MTLHANYSKRNSFAAKIKVIAALTFGFIDFSLNEKLFFFKETNSRDSLEWLACIASGIFFIGRLHISKEGQQLLDFGVASI